MTTPKWKKFEELVAKIQEEFSPEAVVTLDDRIEGKITGTKRQVDISIRKNIGQYKILIGIDCKNLSAPVDVKGVEEVIGLIQDIGANKGSIVSASGFTSTALIRGEKAGLDLLRLIDTGDHDWKAYATLPALCHYCGIKSASFKFSGTGQFVMPHVDDFREIEVYNDKNELLGKLGEILLRQFRKDVLPKEPGLHKDVDFIKEKTKLKHEDQFYSMSITANIHIESASYYGELPLDEISGFKDEITGVTAVKSMTTSNFCFEDIEKNWKKIDREEDLAIKPVLTFWLSN
jgi:hypothetical protein